MQYLKEAVSKKCAYTWTTLIDTEGLLTNGNHMTHNHMLPEITCKTGTSIFQKSITTPVQNSERGGTSQMRYHSQCSGVHILKQGRYFTGQGKGQGNRESEIKFPPTRNWTNNTFVLVNISSEMLDVLLLHVYHSLTSFERFRKGRSVLN